MNAPKLTVVIALCIVAACGRKGTRPSTEPTGRSAAAVPEEDPEPEIAPAVKSPPKQWYAKAALTPVKGAKVKPAIVSLSQREGEDTSIEADTLSGVRPGMYWLQIHDNETCGPNATKVGAVWPGAGDTTLRVVVDKDMTGGLETNTVRFALAGDVGAVGHALVLHEDKKGKPGKPLACGVIEEVDEP